MKTSFSSFDILKNPPVGSIIGINYSGMHDSAIALVSPEGTPLFAVSLERVSRVKQDGRPLYDLLEGVKWEHIDKVAISAPKSLQMQVSSHSQLLSTRLPQPRLASTLKHGQGFYDALSFIPCEKVFVGHQEAHAASAFWGSGFEESLCLTYDGGMSNDIWFGGLYRCNKLNGIQPLDRFNALQYAKVTTLYTFVTALLGFLPLRHEGKITGLAAYGKPTERCNTLLKKWFEQDYFELEKCLYWLNCYDNFAQPQLVPSASKLKHFRMQINGISKEELAATLQNFVEQHILQLLLKARTLGWDSQNICLAGGLFANVKINQVVAESGYEQIFVAPPMTDDGTALGAAWHVASTLTQFKPESTHSMFLGPKYSEVEVLAILNKESVKFSVPLQPAEAVAELLAEGKIVAVFQGACEFGPRALGNRSILAQATLVDINQSLNLRLNRTEFMPFAPMTMEEDAELCYHDVNRVRHAAEFMTVTVNCTDIMKAMCPAVVHVDGTARPQLVSAITNPFIHQVLTSYKKITGQLAIINTSFNVHEEPIVCSPEDALRGFFESGLDYLYLADVGLISFAANQSVAIGYLQEKLKVDSHKSKLNASINDFLDTALSERTEWLESASADLIQRTNELVETRQVLIERTSLLEQANHALVERTDELVETRQVLIERTSLLEQANHALVERTDELVETRQVLIGRTSLLEQANHALAERTDELAETRQVLIERTSLLEQANHALVERAGK